MWRSFCVLLHFSNYGQDLHTETRDTEDIIHRIAPGCWILFSALYAVLHLHCLRFLPRAYGQGLWHLSGHRCPCDLHISDLLALSILFLRWTEQYLGYYHDGSCYNRRPPNDSITPPLGVSMCLWTTTVRTGSFAPAYPTRSTTSSSASSEPSLSIPRKVLDLPSVMFVLNLEVLVVLLV